MNGLNPREHSRVVPLREDISELLPLKRGIRPRKSATKFQTPHTSTSCEITNPKDGEETSLDCLYDLVKRLGTVDNSHRG